MTHKLRMDFIFLNRYISTYIISLSLSLDLQSLKYIHSAYPTRTQLLLEMGVREGPASPPSPLLIAFWDHLLAKPKGSEMMPCAEVRLPRQRARKAEKHREWIGAGSSWKVTLPLSAHLDSCYQQGRHLCSAKNFQEVLGGVLVPQ